MVLLLQLVEVKKNIYVGVKLVLHVSDGLSLILVEDRVVKSDFLVWLLHTRELF